MEQQLRENFKKCNRNLKQISVNVQKFPLLLNRKTEVLFKGHVSLDKKAVTSPLQSLLAPWVLSAADMVCVINKDHVDKKGVSGKYNKLAKRINNCQGQYSVFSSGVSTRRS